MGSKNFPWNAALSQSSTEYVEKIELKADAEANTRLAIQVAPAPEFDLSVLPTHPALVIFDNKSIGIHIDQCKNMEEKIINMGTLIKTLASYAPHVKSIDINIHAPYPHHESTDVQKRRTRCFKRFFVEINKFKLVSLHVCMLLDEDWFPQMKLAAGIMGLEFKDWTLMYEVLGDLDQFPVPRGSEFDRRLLGVFKKEVLAA